MSVVCMQTRGECLASDQRHTQDKLRGALENFSPPYRVIEEESYGYLLESTVNMALVSYSDSDSDSDSAKNQSKPTIYGRGTKRRRDEGDSSSIEATRSLPPIPNEFLDLYTSNTRVSVTDDPSLHGGRKRAIPHVEGNWPTHVYLECRSRSSFAFLSTA